MSEFAKNHRKLTVGFLSAAAAVVGGVLAATQTYAVSGSIEVASVVGFVEGVGVGIFAAVYNPKKEQHAPQMKLSHLSP